MAQRSTIGIDSCLDYSTIINGYNGEVIENQDGTVSVYITGINGLTPLILSKTCCQYIKPGYTFDIETQECRWASPTCSIDSVFKLVLNPKGNDGTLFYVEENDNCTLNIDFDYLFKVKCETLSDLLLSVVPFGTGGIKGLVDPAIAALQNQIETQTTLCESYTQTIEILTSEYINTSYSIYCDNVAVRPTYENVTTGKTQSFGKTGFGGSLVPFGLYLAGTISSGQNYCLTEPAGLLAWQTLLGNTNYYNFTQGDINSFSCKDVQTIYDQNEIIITNNIVNNTQNPVLLVPCDTPFGTKTKILNDINTLIKEQDECQQTLIKLQSLLPSEPISAFDSPIGCLTPLDMFESFDVSLTLDIVTSANTLQTIATLPLFNAIGSGNLYQYLTANTNSGFYVCGDSTDGCTPLSLNLSGIPQINTTTCDDVMNNIVSDLFIESGLSGTSGANSAFINSLSSSALASNWLHFSTGITDTNILSAITNQYIKISIQINHACGDFCVLIDDIVLDKVCTHVESNNIFLTQSPGFGLERIRDNRKSWINNTTPTNRPFVISNNVGGNSIRQTNYDVNDERLVINTKEIDLDINLATAIETDVWCFLNDNPCLLTGITTCLPCVEECGNKNFQDDECFMFMDNLNYDFMDGVTTTTVSQFNHSNCCGDNMIDFNELMTQPLSSVTTVEDFQYFLTSELIDAKNRKTLSGYPTLRALYDRYMNSGLYCGNNSSRFDYLTMEQFAGLLGNYWVDIVEQVIPATTIWGSVKVYTNTIFDQQKFKYKSYSSLFCENNFSGQTLSSPINGALGQCVSVGVETTSIIIPDGDNLVLTNPIKTVCDSICIAQMNSGSEFIGKISIVGPSAPSLPNLGYNANAINEL